MLQLKKRQLFFITLKYKINLLFISKDVTMKKNKKEKMNKKKQSERSDLKKNSNKQQITKDKRNLQNFNSSLNKK